MSQGEPNRSNPSLSDLAKLGDDEIPLAETALRIARAEYPDLDARRWLAEIDRLAARAHELAEGPDPCERLAGLDCAFFEEAGFRGDEVSYYDPRNSFLNDVIERRLGIPITLSVLYIEIGRRLGLGLRGIGFPGHFLVGCYTDDDVELIDPFRGGARVTEDDCRDMLATSGSERSFEEHFLAPVSHRYIVVRMLTNLKYVYLHHNDLPRAVAAMSRILEVAPSTVGELRDRGLIRLKTGEVALALRDLHEYIDSAPHGAELDSVRKAIAIAQRALARLN